MEATSFVVTRDQTVGPLTVPYIESGAAQAGTHYAPLPGEVDFADGESTATIQVEPLANDEGGLVDLTVTLEEPEGGTIGDPGAATIHFVTEATNPSPCSYDFRFTDAPRNAHQDLTVGQGLEPFELELEVGGRRFASFGPDGGDRHKLVAGALPPGIVIACFPNGTPVEQFQPDPQGCRTTIPQGTATTAGTYAATIEVCGSDITFDCETAELTVVVRASTSGSGLAMTGGRSSWIAASMAGLLGGGMLWMLRRQRRRSETGGSSAA